MNLNALSRTTVVLLAAALLSGIMVSSAVSAHPLLSARLIGHPVTA